MDSVGNRQEIGEGDCSTRGHRYVQQLLPWKLEHMTYQTGPQELRRGINFTLSGEKFESAGFQQTLNFNSTLNNVAVRRVLVLTHSAHSDQK